MPAPELEELIDRFEEGWQKGTSPSIADLVSESAIDSEADRRVVLAELIAIDLEYRWKSWRQGKDGSQAGDLELPAVPRLEDYQNDYPEIGQSGHLQVDLLAEEYRVRLLFGDKPPRDEYLSRFGAHREGLGEALARVEQFIASERGEPSVELASVASENVDTMADGSRTQSQLQDTFGRYRILGQLGRGGMGTVYRALDTQLQREVALKIPRFDDADNDLIRRFYREARAAAVLHHPGICPVFDVGEIDGQHYITMAFIKGRALREFTKGSKPQGVRQIVRVIRRLALALVEAHKHNIIHRDLKPANVMIDDHGRPVVMDFGLARRAVKGEEKLTHSGTVIGTPAYMSPEQVDGDSKRVGPPADIYSLGVMLYELLTGQLPFHGNLLSILKQIATVEPQPPTKLRREIPPELEVICMKMMAKRIEDRYQSMDEVAAALTDCLKQKSDATVETDDLKSSEPFESHQDRRIETTVPETVSAAKQPKATEPLLPDVAFGRYKTRERRRRRLIGKANTRRLRVVGGVVAAALLLVGTMLYVQWSKVSVEITVDDSSLTLNVDGNPVAVKGEKARIRLIAGLHTLIVTRDGEELEPKKFTVTKGGQNGIHVVIVDDETVIVSTGNNGNLPASADPFLDLLPLVDISSDAGLGSWRRTPDGLACDEPNSAAVLQLPYEPPEEYILEIEFTPTAWGMNVNHYLAAQGRMFAFKLHAHGRSPPLYGFEQLDGKKMTVTDEARAQLDLPLRTGQRYRSMVEVRKGTLRAELDGRELVKWTGDFSRLSMEDATPMPYPRRLGIGSWKRAVTFHSVRVREISGQGVLHRTIEATKTVENTSQASTRTPEPVIGGRSPVSTTQLGQWQVLFDGTSLTAWKGLEQDAVSDKWEIVGDVLVGSAKQELIVSRQEFGDFELEFVWSVERRGNGGVCYQMNANAKNYLEYQVIAPALSVSESMRSGAMFKIYSPSSDEARPVGDWNSSRLLSRGKRIEHWLNGKLVVSCEVGTADWKQRVSEHWMASPYHDQVKRPAPIALQSWDGVVRYRNIRIRTLTRD